MCDLRHAESVPILCGKSTGEASGTPQKNTCNVPTEESRTRSSANMCTRHLAPRYLLLQQVFCCRARLARQTPHRPHRHAWSRQPVRLLALALRPMMRGLKAPLRMPDAADAVPKPRNRIGRFSHRFPPIRAQRPWLPPPLAAPSGPANPTEASGITTAGASRRLVAIEHASPRRRRREGSDDWLAPGVDADLDGMACKGH